MSDSRPDPSVELRRAALELFARRGYHATSLQDIADRVGYTKANVLYHFGSKQALFDAAIAPVAEDFEALTQAPASDTEHGRLEWADRLVEFLLTHEYAVSIFINQLSTLHDQPAVARLSAIIFSTGLAPIADPDTSGSPTNLRNEVALAGAAYLIAQRTNEALDESKASVDDETFAQMVRSAVREIVSLGAADSNGRGV